MIVQVGERAVELIQKIGEGGTGEVYEGRFPDTGESVAVKVLRKRFAEMPEFVKRYHREAEALRELRHPSFVKIFGEGELPDGRVFLAMELLKGEPSEGLRDRVQKEGHHVLRLFIEVARALNEAHEAGIVHRDLKPENLILDRKGGGERLRILDFGFVRFDEKHDATDLTKQGTVLGTMGFMSLEQLRGENVDGRSDVYALAVTLYETFAGTLPFDAKNTQVLFKEQSAGRTVPLTKHLPGNELAAKLDPILQKAMAAHRDARTKTMEMFANELETLVAEDTAARAMSPWKIGLLAFIVGALLAGAVLAAMYFLKK